MASVTSTPRSPTRHDDYSEGGRDSASQAAQAAPGRLRLASVQVSIEASRQIKSRERVQSLAEVYTHRREVDAMLDLIPGMFPSDADPGNTDRTFLEPACGSGNFLEEILRRKLFFVSAHRYGRGERYEHRVLRCLASIYGIDINADNVEESRDRLRRCINAHLDRDLGAEPVSLGFLSAVEVVLGTNIIHADALVDASTIEIVEYAPGPQDTFTREWSALDPDARVPDLFSPPTRRDAMPVYYGLLSAHPEPIPAGGVVEGVA